MADNQTLSGIEETSISIEEMFDRIEVLIKIGAALSSDQNIDHLLESILHERMDGKGYPRGLTRDQMSVQARLMGIADIFEALTAKDRPYKKLKTLSETLNILGKMSLDGHIDPDLFDIFVRKQVYLHYAKKFLEPEQIDEIDF